MEMTERRDDIIITLIKEQAIEFASMSKEQTSQFKELSETLHKIDKQLLKQEFIEKDRQRLKEEHEIRFKKIEVDIEVFREDYIGKKSITKILGGFALFAGLCISGLMYQIEHSSQLLEAEAKRMEQREAYARTIPSPEQESKIKKLEDALLNSKASLTSREKDER